MLNSGTFGVPLDVCAQSMYRAIKSVVEKVSNLSLHEIHLVNINGETTQLIQSIFLQLNSSPDDAESEVSEHPPPEKPEDENPPSSPQELSPGGDDSVPGVGVEDEALALKTSPDGRNTLGDDVTEEYTQDDDVMESRCHLLDHDEVLDHPPENVQISAVETSPDGRNTECDDVTEDRTQDDDATENGSRDEVPDPCPENAQTSALKTSPDGRNTHCDDVMEDHTQYDDVTKDRVHLLVAAPQDHETRSIPEDEEVLDQEQSEEEQEESLDEHCQHSLPVIPDTSRCFEGAGKPCQKNPVGSQKNLVGSQSLMEQDDKTSVDQVQGTKKVCKAEDGDDQTFDVKICDQDQKSLASGQDQEDWKLTKEVILFFI